MKQEECSKEKDNLKDKSEIDQIRGTINIIVREMDILHTKIKQLDNEFQESKEKIKEKINEMIDIVNKLNKK